MAPPGAGADRTEETRRPSRSLLGRHLRGVCHVAYEDTSSSFEDQPTGVRARRAAVMAGVGLVWAAFMAAIGLFWFAGLVLVAAGGRRRLDPAPRLPRYDLRGGLGRIGRFIGHDVGRVRRGERGRTGAYAPHRVGRGPQDRPADP